MATTAPPQARIASLDIIRGIAVMGIFSVNVVGMAMIENAYFFPPDYGFDGLGDKIMWALNFLFIDGRFRSLFSILFGASMVLVIERAVAAGKAGWKVHYPRMIVLLAFGLAHFYLLWWGDILASYALVGMVAYPLWKLRIKTQLIIACSVFALAYVPSSAFGIAFQFDLLPADMGPPVKSLDDPERLQRIAEEVAAEGRAATNPAAHLAFTLEEMPFRPFTSVLGFGWETLALMLLGMVGYRSGFLTGDWSRERYTRIAIYTLVPMLIYHATVAVMLWQSGFPMKSFIVFAMLLSEWFHPIGAMGYAAAIILLVKSGAIADRLAAVGRAAFTNYLGCTIIGVLVFYEFAGGLWGDVSRGEAWLLTPPVWALMLLWSKWWLDRYRYGPLEWAWRSLSRWTWEPMRKAPAPAPAA